MIVAWLFLSMLHAQSGSLYFEKINADNGLSHNKVNCILQDRRGFIWIGTEDGLNRFDGNDFLVFRAQPGRSDCLSGNIITALLEDKDGVLWIATADGGLSRYDYKLPPAQQFKQYKHQHDKPSSIPTNTIHAMLEDRQGYLWLGTGGHLILRFDKEAEQFEEPVKEGTRTALALGLDHQDSLWVGRQGGGLLKLNTRTLEYTSDPRYANLYANLPHVVVTSLFEDKDKAMWYGSWDKILYRYDPDSDTEVGFPNGTGPFEFNNDEVTDIAEDAFGRIWLAGKQFGLQMLDKGTNRFTSFRYNPALAGTIADDRVNCIFLDKAGHIWAGTNKGISIARLEQQFIQQFLPGAFDSRNPAVTIHDFYRDDRHRLWIGTSNGLYLQDKGSATIEHIPIRYNGESLSVSTFFKDVDGAMYLGTNYSLFRYEPESRSIALLQHTELDRVMNHLIESRVVSVIRDTIAGHPVLLASPYGHYLAYYDLVDQRWISRVDTAANIVEQFNLKDNLIRRFYRDGHGRIWLAMAGQGLGLWEKSPQPFVRYFNNNPSDPTSISNNNVYDLVEDEKGNLWVTTYGGGLQYFDTRKYTFRHIPSSGNLLEGIERDNLGRLWMISGGVLHQYTHADSSYLTFDLPDLENAGGIRGNIFKDSDGLLYVAGPDYFIRFHPADIRPEVTATDILFTDFKIFNISHSHLLFEKEIALRYNQNYFTIEFAAPHPPGSEKFNYRYMMEGVDEDWIEAGTRNTASYPNTGSGHFIFNVQASPDHGRWPVQMASLHISVVPPVWKRWWFLTLMVLVVLGVIMGIQRYRVNELLKRQEIRNRIAQDLHDNVGSTLSSISVYSQVAKIRNEEHNDSQLNELLGKISVTSNDMISDMNDIVWAINPRNDSMEKIVQRMESYARPLLATRNIQLNLNFDQAILQVNMQMEKRKNIYLIFKEAINNAFKYSGCTLVQVDLNLRRKSLEMQIRDDGVGFDIHQEDGSQKLTLSGNGLDNIRSRAKEMEGEVHIDSTPGQGTQITLSVNIP